MEVIDRYDPSPASLFAISALFGHREAAAHFVDNAMPLSVLRIPAILRKLNLSPYRRAASEERRCTQMGNAAILTSAGAFRQSNRVVSSSTLEIKTGDMAYRRQPALSGFVRRAGIRTLNCRAALLIQRRYLEHGSDASADSGRVFQHPPHKAV